MDECSWASTAWEGRITLGVNNLLDRTSAIQYQVPNGSAPMNPPCDIDRFWFLNYVKRF